MFFTLTSRRQAFFFCLHMSEAPWHFARTPVASETGDRVLHDDKSHLREASFERVTPYLDHRRAICLLSTCKCDLVRTVVHPF